jgi:hypothetical protein
VTWSTRRRSPAALFAAAAVLATAACGSTVQGSGQTVLGDGQAGPGSVDQGGLVLDGSDGLGPPPVDGVTGGGSGAAGTGDAFAGGGSGGSSSSNGGGSGATGSSSGGAVQQPGATGGSSGGTPQQPGTSGGGTAGFAAGPGVTDKTIAIGLTYCGDCAAANAAIGVGGEDPGDTRRYYQAALDEVNGRGGVLGRKLVPVWHEISASDSVDVSAQEMCETFTKDNKVAAIQFRGEIIYECAKKAGIIALGTGGSGPTFERFPNLIAHNTIRLERLGAATVKGMVAAGWHKPSPKWPTGKIGLVTWQDNDYEFAMKNGWLPALRESGLKETDVRYIAVPQSDKSLADSSSAINSAVLAFREKGIDHVFLADGPAGIFRGGGLTLQFLNAARSQRYFPRYGFNGSNAPGDPALPADQQVGMIAINSNDFEKSNDQGIPVNPQRERCYALMKKKSLKATDGGYTGLIAIQACDLAWFVEAVFQRATRGTTLPDVIAAAESIGTSYRSPLTYGNRLGPGRHDGIAYFRNARFDEACECMKYTSKPYEP